MLGACPVSRVHTRSALRRSPVALLLGLLAVCASFAGLGAAAAGASSHSAGPPTAFARPHRALRNGQPVSVHWHRFNTRKDTYVGIEECTKAGLIDGNSAHCDGIEGTLRDGRRGVAPLTVSAGTIGSMGETCGTSHADANNCVIIVVGLTASLTPVARQFVAIPINFTV
jgi:hypothetical protein